MTANKNISVRSRAFLMLLVAVLMMSFMALPSAATGDGLCVTVDAENADKAEILLNGEATESISVTEGEEFTLDVTVDDGYFIRKILLVSNPDEDSEKEEIIPLSDNKSFSGSLVAEADTVIEIAVTSDSFSFFDSFLGFDLSVFQWVQSIRNKFLDAFMTVVTTLGDEGIIFIAMALVLLFTKKYRKIGFTMLVALVVMLICNNFVLKEIFARERPFNLYATFPEKFADWGGEAAKYIFPNLVEGPHSYSFPSGHTSSAFAAGVAVLCYNRKLGIPTTLFAFLMGFTRIYVGVHYATDVIAGAIVGCIYALMGVLLAKYLFPIADKLLDKILSKLFKKTSADK